jgi:hypothetical protein
MKQLHIGVLAILIALSLLVACESSTPTSEKSTPTAAPAKKEPSPYTGLQAFNTAQALALKWAPDAIPVRLESQTNSEDNGQKGTATVWKAGFLSPGRRTVQFITCSGSRLPDSPPYGVSADNEQPYSPDALALQFQAFMLKVDSDKAFETAQQHGGDALLKKDPNQIVTYTLLWNSKQHALLWYVTYGKDQKTAVSTGIVNATTGAWVGVAKK